MSLAHIIKADLSARKKTLWKSVLYVTMLFVFMSLIFCYATTISRGMKKADEVNDSGKNLWVVVDKNEIAEKTALSAIKEITGVESIYIVGQKHAGTVTNRKFKIEGQGTVDGCFYYTIFRDSLPAEFESEMDSRGLGSLFAAGRYIENNDEIVCTQEILDCFQLTDPNRAIGKVLEVSYEEMGISHSFRKTIVGVFNRNIVELDYFHEEKWPMICFSFDEVWNYILRPSEEDENLTEAEKTSIFLEDNRNLPNLWLFYEVYYDTYLNKESVFAALHNVSDGNIVIPIKEESKKMATLEFQSGTLVTILSVLCALLCAGALCAYLLDMVKSVTSEEDHYQVLVAMGFSRRKLFAFVFFEELIKTVIGIVVAMSAGAISVFGISKKLSDVIGVTVIPNYRALLVLFAINAGVGLLMSCIAAVTTCCILKKKGMA